ncbi:hypothetical protein QCA50_008736 [Cerrena zonata]|uniref:Auxin efflux carrier n=1 Tax=Cerrena zonata TaxID=2478898 RepID=A0AAW0G9P8_9APHY
MLGIGTLIWVSFRPLLRLVICVGCGFILTRADIFPVIAARGAGQLLLNVASPCLMFSKIVPAFNSDNIGSLGPLVLVAAIYQILGLLFAFVIKKFCWLPHRFRHGIYVAGGWGNYGDIPTSVVMSIAGSAPFKGVADQNLSIAYISVFILVFYVTLFPMGGHALIAKDFVGPEVEDEEVRELAKIRRHALLQSWKRFPSLLRRRRVPSPKDQVEDLEKVGSSSGCATPISISEKGTPTEIDDPPSAVPVIRQPIPSATRHVAFHDPDVHIGSPSITEVNISRVASPAPTLTHADTMTHVDNVTPAPSIKIANGPESKRPKSSASSRGKRTKRIRSFLSSLVSPPSLAIIISFPVALVTPLKALFVPIANSPIPNAPDGQPPLAFVQDAATFIGAAAVPLGLICLGSALARLNVPMNRWRTLPLGAIFSLAVAKLIITPVLGVLICEGLTRAGVIDPSDKVLRFVCIFFSCLPTATTQVYLTQVYSGTGSAEHISAFLIPQYALMFVSMIVLTAYSINSIF